MMKKLKSKGLLGLKLYLTKKASLKIIMTTYISSKMKTALILSEALQVKNLKTLLLKEIAFGSFFILIKIHRGMDTSSM